MKTLSTFYKYVARYAVLTFVVVGAFGVGFAGSTYHVRGQFGIGPTGLAYGGRILDVIPCVCSGGFWRLIGPPSDLPIIFEEGLTMPYMWYMFFVMEDWTLGKAVPGGVCSTFAACIPIEAAGTSLMEGTSLIPAPEFGGGGGSFGGGGATGGF